MPLSRIVRGIAINVALHAVLLFAPAGTLHWWRAWVIVAIVFVALVACVIAMQRAGTGILEERFKPPVQAGQPGIDKLVLGSFLVTKVYAEIFIPLDVFRLHLLPGPPTFVSWLGLLMYAAGWWLMAKALLANAFASPVVKHDQERQHKVVDSGVYAIVRHPMYSGVFLFMIGLPLWLQSTAGLLVQAVPLAVLALRIVLEERFLLRELSGYAEYRQRVRYRLLPLVW